MIVHYKIMKVILQSEESSSSMDYCKACILALCI